MFLHGLRGDRLQKTAAAFRNVPPGGRKITCVPRVGHIAGAGGVVEQTVDFARRVAAADAGHIADVGAVHPDEQVVFVVVRPRHLPRRVRSADHTMRRQLPPRGWVDRVAELLGACRRRVNDEPLPCPALAAISFITNSAIGLRQMLPWQINSIFIILL